MGDEGKDIPFLGEVKGFAPYDLNNYPGSKRMVGRADYMINDAHYLIKADLIDYSILLKRRKLQYFPTNCWAQLNTNVKDSLHAVPIVVHTQLRNGEAELNVLYFGIIDILKVPKTGEETMNKCLLKNEASAKSARQYGKRWLAFSELVFGWDHVKSQQKMVISSPCLIGPSGLPPGWSKVKSQDARYPDARYFYWNANTRTSQWNKPGSAAIATRPEIYNLPFYGCLKEYLETDNPDYLKQLCDAIAKDLTLVYKGKLYYYNANPKRTQSQKPTLPDSDRLLADMPKDTAEIGQRTRRRLAFRRKCDSPVMLRLLNEIRVANGLEPLHYV